MKFEDKITVLKYLKLLEKMKLVSCLSLQMMLIKQY